jgi:hypothetical protein
MVPAAGRCHLGGVVVDGVPHVVMQPAIAASITDGNGPAKDLHYLEDCCARPVRGSRPFDRRYQDNAAWLAPATLQGIYPHFPPSDDAAFPMIATKDAGRFAADALVSPATKSETVLLRAAYPRATLPASSHALVSHSNWSPCLRESRRRTNGRGCLNNWQRRLRKDVRICNGQDHSLRRSAALVGT